MEVDKSSKAEAFKTKGNDQFKLGNYQAAIEYYSDAIGKSPALPAPFPSRAVGRALVLAAAQVFIGVLSRRGGRSAAVLHE